MNNKVRYEVWVLGYDKENLCTDIETLLATFETEIAAVTFAKAFETVKSVTDNFVLNASLLEGDYLEIVVETIYEDDQTNTNIDTKYQEYIY